MRRALYVARMLHKAMTEPMNDRLAYYLVGAHGLVTLLMGVMLAAELVGLLPGNIAFAAGCTAINCLFLYWSFQGLLYRMAVRQERKRFEAIVVNFRY